MTQVLLLHQESDAGWIEVWEEAGRRLLWFDDDILQSEIDLKHPGTLPNPVNRAMLAHLLFGQQPRSVLLAGCGGGAIARWFHYHTPGTRGLAVEISAEVALIAREYFDFPAKDSLWNIAVKDVRDEIQRSKAEFDFILVDVAVGTKTANWVTSEPFLAGCHQALSPGGVLTINLIGETTETFAESLMRIRRIFNRRTLCLSVPGHENIQVMAFKDNPDLAELEYRLPERSLRWGLGFEAFWKRIREENPSGSGVL